MIEKSNLKIERDFILTHVNLTIICLIVQKTAFTFVFLTQNVFIKPRNYISLRD